MLYFVFDVWKVMLYFVFEVWNLMLYFVFEIWNLMLYFVFEVWKVRFDVALCIRNLEGEALVLTWGE